MTRLRAVFVSLLLLGLAGAASAQYPNKPTKILATAEAQEQLLQQGAYAVQTTPEQAAARVHQEIAMWAKVIKQANIKAD